MTGKNHSEKDSTTSLVLLSVVVVVCLAGVFGYAVFIQKRSVNKRATAPSKVEIVHAKQVPDQLLEETVGRAVLAEKRLSGLTLENEKLKSVLADREVSLKRVGKDLADRTATLKKLRIKLADRKAAFKRVGADQRADQSLLSRTRRDVVRSRKRITELSMQLDTAQTTLSSLKEKYEETRKKVGTLTSDLTGIRERVFHPFRILVSGHYQKITLVEGEEIQGESLTLGETKKIHTIPVPKDRLLRLNIIGDSNVLWIPKSILVRTFVDNKGMFNEISEAPK